MDEEQQAAAEATPPNPPEKPGNVEALEAKNRELLAKLAKLKKNQVPEGVDVEALVKFKAEAEQAQLESKGDYEAARAKLVEQVEAIRAEKDAEIARLRERVAELELIAPASTALADLVHDPELVLKTKLSRDQIEREADGTVVVVDGVDRKPIDQWARSNLPEWMQKAPKPAGGGARGGRGAAAAAAGYSGPNPFARDSYNLTEQSRLFRQDRDTYEALKAAAAR